MIELLPGRARDFANHVFRRGIDHGIAGLFDPRRKRALPASGIGTPGEKAATAIADFLVVDMFANYCTGREDAKGAISIAERQLKRIYR